MRIQCLTSIMQSRSTNGYTEEDSLYDLIAARSTVSSADVKVVLDSLNFVLDRELRAGYIVQMGESATSVYHFPVRGLRRRMISTVDAPKNKR